MAKAIDIHAGAGVDTTDFKKFAKALLIAAPLLYQTLRINLRGVGDIVAQEARSISSSSSQLIPDSIKVRVSGATVSVVAGGAGVPTAGLFELGNLKSHSTQTFRHPVFGRNVWVEQSMHPFLGPAVINKLDAVEAAAVEALDLAIDEAVHGG